jgi:hypothetical protein
MKRWIGRLRLAIAESRLEWLMVLLILLAVFPVSLFQYIPKWDSVIGYLPYRYFVSDYAWNGHLPLWSPFQRLGYPGYSDLQSGCWYPVCWLIMLTGKYTITSLMVELLFTWVIAGLGMYRLIRLLAGCDRTAFLTGLSYALSGFMVGSAHLLVFLIGMAWLPWCILSAIRFFRSPGWRTALAPAFFLSLNITGASPAFTILLMYILTGMALYFLVRSRGALIRLKGMYAGLITGAAAMAVMLAPFIRSFLDFVPYFNRTGKLDYAAAAMNPFDWSNFISFIFPYAVIANSDWFSLTDLSLRNAYAGMAALLAFTAALLLCRSWKPWQWLVFASTVTALMLATGDEGPLFRTAYHLPAFGLFRHPSFFRGYAIFGMLLLAAPVIRSVIRGEIRAARVRLFLLPFAALVLVALIGAALLAPPGDVSIMLKGIRSRMEFPVSGVYSHIALGAALILVLAVLSWLVFRWSGRNVFAAMTVFVFGDMAVQTALTAPTTIHYAVSWSSARDYFRSLPESHDQSYNLTPMKLLDDSQGLKSAEGIYLNLATFNKAPSSVGENPLRFRAFDAAREGDVLQWNLENPLFWLVKGYRKSGDTLQHGLAWNVPLRPPVSPDNVNLSRTEMAYNTFRAQVSNRSEYPQWLILNQNYHHLWKARAGDLDLPVFRVNELVMGVLVPSGFSGEVEWTFSSPGLLALFLPALSAYVLTFILIRRTAREPNDLTFGTAH